ncbi:murein hydrolase activator EnvC family protein [Arthrobacter caoxuetaonis]|uniref:M23 family metallopeptidase n=1 Tax=Arthrobacter caoxuetaonis TaxID=2886935 RepID=A0A9X1MDR1_9MICC|nr:M23 family metallopeptidase [Arthrobacter caoxuetaonis]MCC3297112.1 M23 family metallopeptidase [Arthrobacter caoxuetaonis]USQ58326.1 M23 family metallopeptidase [Arthrobacter caoxuetaonis]
MTRLRRATPLRAAVLLLLMVAALAAAPWPGAAVPAPGALAAWQWPVTPQPDVVRGFDKPAQRWLAGHRGVDLAAAGGTAVRSPAGGTVRFAGHVVDRPVLTVDHGGGLVSSFEPVASTLSPGEAVAAGQTVGLLDVRPPALDPPGTKQPHCPGSCLHWGVRLDGEYVDPLRFILDRRPSILLPLPAGPGS